MVTINDVWKHISNKIANKVNDPFEDLFAMIIPIDEEGNFGPAISSDCEEYDGDSYTLLKKLTHSTNKLPTGTFAYACPARIMMVSSEEEAFEMHKKMVETGVDPRSKALVMTLVHAITVDESSGLPSDVRMDNGVYWIDGNRFDVLPSTINGEVEGGEAETGGLTIALGGLALKWSLDHGKLGELGVKLGRALETAEKSMNEAKAAFDQLRDNI